MDHTYGYKIYLHERNQFWPGADMFRLGQTQRIYLNIKTLLRGNFKLVKRRTLNTAARPCVEDNSFSFTSCMMEFVARRIGCHLGWVGRYRFPEYPSCKTLMELIKYSELLEMLADLSWVRLTRVTGCHAKCQYQEFRFTKVNIVRK